MCPVLELMTFSERAPMENRSCPAEKTEPLLGSQETQMKQNGTTHVTIPSPGAKNSTIGPTGLLSGLKPWAHRWAVQSLVLNLVLIITILILLITLSAKTPELSPADAAFLVAACPDSWIGHLGKCYYFSLSEGNWTYSQSHCSALGASLAAIDTQQEMNFMMRYKGLTDYWIGLWRERNQPWKWVNGTKFNNWFKIVGGEKCAFVNSGDIASSGCSREGHWICSKPAEKPAG